MYKRPKEFAFLDLDIESRHLYNCLRSLTKETKAIGFVRGYHAPGVDDAPNSGFDPLKSKGYSAQQCIRELNDALHEFGRGLLVDDGGGIVANLDGVEESVGLLVGDKGDIVASMDGVELALEVSDVGVDQGSHK
ncbi:hypothetical protein Q3G72_026812 [Acer saccharum]|nr:hypothetical protein Q3G72_026812 [Acer saccharum]